MHRQTTKLASRFPRGKRFARKAERLGYATTYELHDRLLSNRTSRRRYAASSPQLDDLQQTALSALEADGCAVLSFSDLIGDRGLADAVLCRGDEFVVETDRGLEQAGDGDAQLHRRAGKEYVIRAHDREGEPLGLDDPWFRAAISDRLLGLANAYLRMWSKLSYVDFWYTVPQSESSERTASQLWHLDFDDRHLLKAFLYLSDVDAGAGPFEYVPGSQPRGRYGDIWRWTPLGTARVPEEEVSRRVPADEIRTFTAPRGTLILCNTSGLHRGGFATAKPRVLAAATFCSPASLAALSLRNYVVKDISAITSPAARFAVT